MMTKTTFLSIELCIVSKKLIDHHDVIFAKKKKMKYVCRMEIPTHVI